ncbi:hypothetical protein MW887_010227 [Aspergillus wentii]|nr:hypothetical protein MW887_010227 [Aspergillus wentii]
MAICITFGTHGSNMLYMSLYPGLTVRETPHFTMPNPVNDRPEITPETRPPPGVVPGRPQPPPQVYAHGALPQGQEQGQAPPPNYGYK